MTTQDSQSDELDKILGHCDFEPEVDNWAWCKWCGESKHNRMHTAKQAIEAYVTTRVKEALETARSKDPHKCEFGHKVYSHNTVDGWCCACESDQAFMEAEIEARVKEAETKEAINQLEWFAKNIGRDSLENDINLLIQEYKKDLKALTTTPNSKGDK